MNSKRKLNKKKMTCMLNTILMLKQNKLSESKSVRGKAKPIQTQDSKISTRQAVSNRNLRNRLLPNIINSKTENDWF